MSAPVSFPSPPRPPFPSVLQRIAFPLLLFSAVLVGLLLLSALLLLPKFGAIEVSGRLLEVSNLAVVRGELLADVRTLENRRHRAMLPVRDERYARLREERSREAEFDAILSFAERQARTLSTQPDAVHIQRVRYAPTEGLLHIDGDVRFVGERSITLLAEFVSLLRQLPSVGKVEGPRYVREQDPHIGWHSPFSLTVTLFDS